MRFFVGRKIVTSYSLFSFAVLGDFISHKTILGDIQRSFQALSTAVVLKLF